MDRLASAASSCSEGLGRKVFVPLVINEGVRRSFQLVAVSRAAPLKAARNRSRENQG